MSTRDTGAMLAALPLAAAATLHLGRVLPVRFAYQENALGIVSPATVARYPHQQETFWLLFAAVLGALLAWWLARALAAEAASGLRQALLEALGAAGLLASLWLPAVPGALACAACAAAALGLARRARTGAQGAAPLAPLAAPEPPRGRGWLPLAAGALLLAALLTPPLWLGLWSVARGVPDATQLADTFLFHGEIGQHLAWADAIRRGELHGRDFFCLYGPLFDAGIAALWELTGRSIVAFKLYLALGRVAAGAVALLLCAALLRRRLVALALPALLPLVDLRVGLALAGLLLLVLARERGGRALPAAAGVAAGVALLYSQEFGLALLVAAALGFAITRDARAAAAFAVGLLAALLPVLGWFAAHGALAPMLHDLVTYPGYIIAGFGKRPFPDLYAQLPLSWEALRSARLLDLRLGYGEAVICAGALLLCAPLASLRLRRAPAWLAAARDALAADPARLGVALVAVFGALAFRTALGRSDATHIGMVLPPAALLAVVALDRVLDGWLAQPGRRVLHAVRALALLLLVLHAGMPRAASPLTTLGFSFSDLALLARGGYEPRGNAHVREVADWIEANTQSAEPVLFLPDAASYYYLTRRASPIRFVVSHQIVTDALRAEVLAALEAKPPRFVVWDDAALRIDDIDPRRYLGPALVAWIERGYVEQARLGAVRILRRRSEAPPP